MDRHGWLKRVRQENDRNCCHHHGPYHSFAARFWIFLIILLCLLEVKLPYEPVCPSVGRSVGLSVFHNFKFNFPCSYRSTCYKILYIITLFLSNWNLPLPLDNPARPGGGGGGWISVKNYPKM